MENAKVYCTHFKAVFDIFIPLKKCIMQFDMFSRRVMQV